MKNGSPVNGIAASAGRSAKNRPKPAATPSTAATLDSTVEITEICRGVAPTRRIAAKRCSRRAADSRVAPPMKISTGNSSAAATTDRISVMPLALMPTPSAQSALQLLGAVVLISVDLSARRPSADRSAALRPMTMISESGDGSAAVADRADLRARDSGRRAARPASCAAARPAPARRRTRPGRAARRCPGGTGESGPVAATSTRPISLPWK